jgi:hypothetical protein
MMIPQKSDVRWQLLVTGKKACRCSVLPANILLERITNSTRHDNSPENIQQCVEETYNFFVRYEAILTQDIKQLFGCNNERVSLESG